MLPTTQRYQLHIGLSSFLMIWVVCMILFAGCNEQDEPDQLVELIEVSVGSETLPLDGVITESLPVDQKITLDFSVPVDQASAAQAIRLLRSDGQPVDVNINFTAQDKTVVIFPIGALDHNAEYTIEVSGSLTSASGGRFNEISVRFKTMIGNLQMLSARFNGHEINEQDRLTNIPVDLQMTFEFNFPVDESSIQTETNLEGPGVSGLNFTTENEGKTVVVTSKSPLQHLKDYTFSFSDALQGAAGESFEGFSRSFYTAIDSTYKFPEISDDALLTKVQEYTFKYFWDFAHPHSGLARERNTSGDLVTIGGSGFGLMAILAAIERGFITRQQGVDRLEQIIDFLKNADRFHGVWPHWMNGNTGKVIPFSPDDDGGDLVETAFMIQGLLTVRQYLDPSNVQEAAMMSEITALWEAVEWDWYTQDGQDVLYWHWSPNFGWQKNHRIQGWNEALIVYVLAAASPTHAIEANVYHKGWARNGNMANGNEHYGIELPLGFDKGGPLFFAHYSFLGLDPRQLEDQYADYWQQNVNHTLINRNYCIQNPKNYVGYHENSWGLTASDGNNGYSAHAPSNDRGVITPTAALSSMPYTPEESMDALHHFYYLLGDKIWGEYGFYDAFNVTADWYADSYLAIDQGPIMIMIENHRTGLLWDLFMADNEITNGLEKIGF